MKNILKLSMLLLVLTVTACSKYKTAANDLSITVKQESYSDSLTGINHKIQTQADTTTIVFENNIYKSALTIEG